MADILIIGGGVAGLSAGIYAGLSGHNATVCERHAVAGGNLTGWDRNGFHIDNCIHWLTGSSPASNIYPMWEKLGALGDGVEVLLGESLYTYTYEGQSLSLSRDLNKLRDDMLALSPEDKGEIHSLIRTIAAMQGILGVAGESHDETHPTSHLIPVLPQLIKYYNLTAGELGKRFRHPLFHGFFGAFWGNNFGAFSLIYVFAHYCGCNGGLPKGGSTAMAQRMVERFTSLGGNLLLK